MVNDKTLDLLTKFEGFVDHWYPDAGYGWDRPTCCYGHTDRAGQPYYKDTKGKKFTRAEGMEILRRDLVDYEDSVRRLVKVPLNENQHGAMTSFTYNLGENNLESSTLLRKLNSGDYNGASKEFTKWVYSNGKRLRGLVRRRKAERDLFLTPVSANEKIKGRKTLIDLIVKFLKLLFRRRP